MIPTMKFVIFLLVLANWIQNPSADATDSELDDILDENVEEMTLDNYRGQSVAVDVANNVPDTNTDTSEEDTETNIEVFNEETIEKELNNAETGSNRIPTWKILVVVSVCLGIPLAIISIILCVLRAVRKADSEQQ